MHEAYASKLQDVYLQFGCVCLMQLFEAKQQKCCDVECSTVSRKSRRFIYLTTTCVEGYGHQIVGLMTIFGSTMWTIQCVSKVFIYTDCFYMATRMYCDRVGVSLGIQRTLK